MTARAFLGLGSNMGDRIAVLRAAVRALREIEGVELLGVSPVYETEPWAPPPGQRADETPSFTNSVVEIETSLPPAALLASLQEVEARLGRTRGPGTPEQRRYEPRTLDIDILLYGDTVMSGLDDLHIPHLLMHERAFVLRPLCDLAPDAEHPVLYQTVSRLLQTLDDDHEVRRVDLPPRWFD